MMYDVNIVVIATAGARVEERVRRAIQKAGGFVEIYATHVTDDASEEHRVRFRVNGTEALSTVVRAVERVRGAGVAAVSEPTRRDDR